MKRKIRKIPIDIATVTQWNETEGGGIASVNGLDFSVNYSSLRDPYKTPEVGDRIIVYKYSKTEKGGRIVEG
jgi:hypothetical protein